MNRSGESVKSVNKVKAQHLLWRCCWKVAKCKMHISYLLTLD